MRRDQPVSISRNSNAGGIVTLTSYTAFFLEQPKTALNDFSGLARPGTPSEAA